MMTCPIFKHSKHTASKTHHRLLGGVTGQRLHYYRTPNKLEVQRQAVSTQGSCRRHIQHVSYLHSHSKVANGHRAVSESICNLSAWRSLAHFMAFSCLVHCVVLESDVMNIIFHSYRSMDCHMQKSSLCTPWRGSINVQKLSSRSVALTHSA